jgi:hypothetical protein
MRNLIVVAALLASTAAFAQNTNTTQMPNTQGKQLYIQIEPGTKGADGNIHGGVFQELPNTQGNAAPGSNAPARAPAGSSPPAAPK